MYFGATVAAGWVKLADPDRLITTGPYRMSRHPRYVAWTNLYPGVSLILDSGWLLVFLPALAVWSTGNPAERRNGW